MIILYFLIYTLLWFMWKKTDIINLKLAEEILSEYTR